MQEWRSWSGTDSMERLMPQRPRTHGRDLTCLSIKELEKIARGCHYRVEGLAQRLGISRRWLNQLCRKHLHTTPRKLLAEFRASEIERQRQRGKRGKEMLDVVGFRHCSSLTRALRRQTNRGLRNVTVRRSQKAKNSLLNRSTPSRETAGQWPSGKTSLERSNEK